MKVEVYRNLHKNCYSVRACEGEHKGKVIAHASRVLLSSAQFVVREGGRQKVIETGHKNVHAFVRGTLRSMAGTVRLPFDFASDPIWAADWNPDWTHSVTYNPLKWDSFVTTQSTRPVTRASAVLLTSTAGVLAYVPTFHPSQPAAGEWHM